jgi:hypothetical protein
MKRMMLTIAAVVLLGYLGLCSLVFAFQRSMIYFPQPRSSGSGLSTIALPIEGGQVLVSARSHPGPNAVLYFGGNAEDVSYSFPSLSAAFPDHAIYLMHYRGYGGSAGSPSDPAAADPAAGEVSGQILRFRAVRHSPRVRDVLLVVK